MATKQEFRTLHALTEQQLEDMLSFFLARGWKILGSSRLLRPDDLHRLPRLEQMVYREESPGIPGADPRTAADATPEAS